MFKKSILFVGAGALLVGALAIYNIEAKGASKTKVSDNYTINKIVNSYKGKDYFTKDYIDQMFTAMRVKDDTKVIADSDGGLFTSLTDNHAVSKTYDTETGKVTEELSLDSPRATTAGELKEALYEALE